MMKGEVRSTGENRVKIRCAVPAALAAGAMLLAGCAERKGATIPWASAVQIRPLPAQPQMASGGSAESPAPDLKMELPAPPAELAMRRPAPAKPKAEGSNAENNASTGEAPGLAPDLPPQELALAKQETNKSLEITEQNLQAAKGRRLDSVQSDLLSKITGFANEARQAASEGDWTRARNLAKKAQVLSQELAGTL